MSFANKVVIVTGGSSGIGAATAIAFTKEGANVVIVGRNEEKLNNVAEKCINAGKKPLVIKSDITHDGEAERIIKETTEAFEKIDILINNAGLVRFANILDDITLETYDLVMNTNLRSQIRITQVVAPFLIKSKGNIVNVSSVVSKGRPTNPLLLMYSMSKAAFDQFSRGVAADLGPHGVRVNTISPGCVETDILINAGLNQSMTDSLLDVPLRKISQSEEIADIILFITSEKANSITGSDYNVDNGYLLKY
ncbi:3-oxoacyl-[acyl-carrier-protein] reductase FabG-like [Bicyclus anynana]|uniref:3-oxoacyl-[acyl-carrier-protein] reductase FabG-like n=1 Tax=Bicyclus anynana TaxID=110368 RepID=A0A6J1P7A0_BICAN|nr:3-oxoacyl-[acyl-carrier-protein] reductase FabG-like [Bicyclus anynana]